MSLCQQKIIKKKKVLGDLIMFACIQESVKYREINGGNEVI